MNELASSAIGWLVVELSAISAIGWLVVELNAISAIGWLVVEMSAISAIGWLVVELNAIRRTEQRSDILHPTIQQYLQKLFWTHILVKYVRKVLKKGKFNINPFY